MKSLTLLTTALFLILSAAPSAIAQDDTDSTSDTSTSTKFWQASLPGGSYVVALSKITSVSKHSYVIDGNLKVSEVVIDTIGNSLVRFYYIIPVTEDSESSITSGITERAKDIADNVGDRTGANANTMVAKQYPTTTHSKTIEFRLSDEADLDQLLSSARKAWMNNKGRKFTVK
ncbi:hypothetical protein JIN77_03900 [Verrucomicrobiaceae bacterium R5-34]|nr:hypothetical protein [Verrucomicrobiaceae bacterium R5-34]